MTGVIKVLLRLGRSGVVMVSATGGECRNAFDAYVIKWTSLAVGRCSIAQQTVTYLNWAWIDLMKYHRAGLSCGKVFGRFNSN